MCSNTTTKSKGKTSQLPARLFCIPSEILQLNEIETKLALILCFRAWKLRSSRFAVSIRQLANEVGCGRKKIFGCFSKLKSVNVASLECDSNVADSGLHEESCTIDLAQSKRSQEKSHQGSQERGHLSDEKRATSKGAKSLVVVIGYTLSSWDKGTTSELEKEPLKEPQKEPLQEPRNSTIPSSSPYVEETSNRFNNNTGTVENGAKLDELPHAEETKPSEPIKKYPFKALKLELEDALNLATHICPLDETGLGKEAVKILVEEITTYWQAKTIAINNNRGSQHWRKVLISQHRKKESAGLRFGVPPGRMLPGYYKAWEFKEEAR